MNPFSSASETSSALSEILLSGTNALDSFANPPPQIPSATAGPCLGSAVYLRQTELLRQFGSSQSPGPWSLPGYAGGPGKKLYSGVRQRHWGRWVADIRLPQNRMRVWLGTYNSPESAAYAYDRASYKLRGEYARLNFPALRDAAAKDCPEPLQELRASVDAKIQAIYQRLNRQRHKKKIKAEEMQQSESRRSETPSCGPSTVSSSSSSV